MISRLRENFLLLRGVFGRNGVSINILPSMTGLLRWHFIIQKDDCNLIGEKYVFRPGVRIIRKLDKICEPDLNKAVLSPVGEFFSEFTPLYHVICEKLEGITRYIFIDMRYYIRNNFLHHAVVEMDEKDSIIKASFNPYSINRSNDISF